MAHFRTCVEIASTQRHVLAQIYDELCRKEWSEKAYRGTTTVPSLMLLATRCPLHFTGDHDFDVNEVSKKKDEPMLARAKQVMETSAGKVYNAEHSECNSLHSLLQWEP